MDLREAIARLDHDISQAAAKHDTLVNQARLAEQNLADLRSQRDTLEAIAQRYGDDVAQGPEEPSPDPDWAALTRLEAVERLLMETGEAMHLDQISAALNRKGRHEDSVPFVSAALSNIKAKGTAESVKRGWWRFVPADQRVASNEHRSPLERLIAAFGERDSEEVA